MTVPQLRSLLRDGGHHMPYMLYARKAQLVAWIERHVERQRPRCPTCGQPFG